MQSPDFFGLPSEKTLEQIARELSLSDVQRRELYIALQHARADLEQYHGSRIGRGPRKVRMRRLRSVDQALAKLIAVLDKDPTLINDDLPFETREAIAWCASSQLIAKVTGGMVSDAGVRVPDREKSAGLHHGARLLAAQLRLVRDPIVSVLAEESTDVGGPEPDHTRLSLVRNLADAAPGIIGNAATGTAGGKFTKLVDAVFRALKVNTEGLEKLIEHILYHKPSVPKSKK